MHNFNLLGSVFSHSIFYLLSITFFVFVCLLFFFCFVFDKKKLYRAFFMNVVV